MAHARSPDAVLAELGASRHGLTGPEAARRHAEEGPNSLPEPEPPSALVRFARQFASPFIYVLLVAVALSLTLREWSNAAFVGAVVVLNAAIGTVQESRAERSAQALRQMMTARSRVVRDGDVTEIDATEVVVGDLVLIGSGERVPADLRLLEVRDLLVDESLLTGESLPVAKSADPVLPAEVGLGERVNMVFAGTLVNRGRGEGVVTAIGRSSEIGAIANEIGDVREHDPPLIVRMRRFTHRVAAVMVGVAAVFTAVEAARGTPLKEVALVAIALAVSAIPEGLPIAMTVTLAIAGRRMAGRQVIVRHMVAVESLGSCTTIATDKTGTLTVNELTVTDVVLPGGSRWRVEGAGLDPTGDVRPVDPRHSDERDYVVALARAGALCNEGVLAREDSTWVAHGDAVDVSLLVLAHKLGVTRPEAIAQAPLVAEIPFESERRYAASLHRSPAAGGGAGAVELVVKGAAETVVEMCTREAAPGGEGPVTRQRVRAEAERLAAEGRRVIALARRVDPDAPRGELGEDDLRDLTLLGLVGLLDPPRPTAARAVAACRDAGLRVVMVTGDHPATALAIAREVGLATSADQVVTGPELSRASSREAARPVGSLDEMVARAAVFARVEPAQKLSIVSSLIRHGELVAVTGDGANDAPALRQAHVGVAMGRGGTDVAREAADLIVADDDLSSIVAGIEEGRVAYANIRKVISLLVSTGAAELVLLLLALALAMPPPLTAVQLLWLNLVTNGIQDVALAFEPPEGDEMLTPPRPATEGIFNALMLRRIVVVASVIGVTSFGAFRLLRDAGWSLDAARNAVVLLMVLFESAMALNSRSETKSLLRSGLRGNRFLVLGTLLALGVHVGAMHWRPGQDLLRLAPLPLHAWAWTVLAALALLLIIELDTALWRAAHRRTRAGDPAPPAPRPPSVGSGSGGRA